MGVGDSYAWNVFVSNVLKQNEIKNEKITYYFIPSYLQCKEKWWGFLLDSDKHVDFAKRNIPIIENGKCPLPSNWFCVEGELLHESEVEFVEVDG